MFDRIERNIIERLAYFRWIDGGCKEGTAEKDWNDAVEEYEIMIECKPDTQGGKKKKPLKRRNRKLHWLFGFGEPTVSS